MLLTISLSDLYRILRSERIPTLWAEFRRILRICRFPSAPAAAILHLLLRLLRSAVHAELSFIHRTAGTGPAVLHRTRCATLRTEFSRRNSSTAAGPGTSRSPCSVPCRRNRLRCLLLYTLLLLLSHLKQLLSIQTTTIECKSNDLRKPYDSYLYSHRTPAETGKANSVITEVC